MKKLLRRLSGFDRKKEDEDEYDEEDEMEEDEYAEEDEDIDEDEEETDDDEAEEDDEDEEDEDDDDIDEDEEEEDDEEEEEEIKPQAKKKSFFSKREESKPALAKSLDEDEKAWLGGDFEEGQLSIDVFQTPESIVVKSTIAGVKPEDIDIAINNDMLTIRGRREMEETVSEGDYLYRECYWGSFSRSVILPVEVEAEKVEADLENGVLTVRLPKAKVSKQVQIKVKSR
jgi:HSP20 family protein